jgi:putative transposase
MSGPQPIAICLTPRQRTILDALARRATSPQRLVRRARIILTAAEGANNQQIATALGLDRETVRLWRTSWLAAAHDLTADEVASDDQALRHRIAAVLTDHPRSGAPVTFTAAQICQLLALACEPPTAAARPVSHWTPRELADEAVKRGIVPAISPRSVGRFLKAGRSQTPSRAGLADC